VNRPPAPRRYLTHPAAAGVDRAALQSDLAARVRGEVRFDPAYRAVYATDASNFRQVPLGVVLPADVEDLVETVAVCRDHGAPITNRGAGTSLSGGPVNVAVIVDTSRHLTRLEALDPSSRLARCEPGLINGHLRRSARAHGLTFGPDPATHSRCTIGGNVGNNSCGTHSLVAGRTSDNVESLDVVTYDGFRLEARSRYRPDEVDALARSGGRQGEIFAGLSQVAAAYGDAIRRGFPAIPRRVSGYNLDALLPENGFNLAAALVGTEGTCVTVLGAQVRLLPWPAATRLVVAGYASIFDAADHVPELLRAGRAAAGDGTGGHPGLLALEAIDRNLVDNVVRLGRDLTAITDLPPGDAFLLLEVGGDSDTDAEGRARALLDALGSEPVGAALFTSAEQTRMVWEVRESGLGASSQVPGRPLNWAGWEDAAVAPAAVGTYLRRLWDLYEAYGYTSAAVYGHFGDGCVHSRIPFELTSAEGVGRYRAFLDDAVDLVVSLGGSLSGEHGDGQQRAEFLTRMYGPELVEAMGRFKAVWDPDGKMNPGKVVDPVRLFRSDENLRLGSGYRPGDPPTKLALRADGGRLSRSALRCVGVGRCRATDGQTMCPSFQVLGDEEHSTRGRARLLFEMAEGEVITGGWRSPEVFEGLALCLACKACKSECPVRVDMASYKAEFLHHYYRRRLRPRPAYAMGLIMYAARLGAVAPGLANRLMDGAAAGLTRTAAGIHPERRLPRFARRTFRQAFRPPGPDSGSAPKAVLWPDTFTNHFEPEVGEAVAAVMAAAGFDVVVPPRPVCCGRPLYDYGMLDVARRLLSRAVRVTAPLVGAGLPVVVPEPSCAAALADELVEVLPDDPDAAALAGAVCTLDGFLARHAPRWVPPSLPEVLVQAHCHQSAVFGMQATRRLLDASGGAWEMAATGCCGMAGSWGYESDKFALSMAVGERGLLPRVRLAPPGTVVVADGFSCRSQISQGTGKRAVHLGQLIADRLGDHGAGVHHQHTA